MAIFTFQMYSHALHRYTDVTAIVPAEKPAFPGVPFDAATPYRSLYLLHGYSGSHHDWLYGSRIAQLAQQYRVAVFCPSGENSFYLDDSVRDALYEQFVCEELVEFTRRVFPLSHGVEDTAVGGLSMGGYGAFHSGLKHPEVFGSLIALSSALITDGISKMPDDVADRPAANGGGGGMGMSPSYFVHTFGKPSAILGGQADPKALAKKLMEQGGPRPRVYQACGSEDFLIEPNRSLHEYLTEIGYPHYYVEGHGAHAWEYWDYHIEKALGWWVKGSVE